MTSTSLPDLLLNSAYLECPRWHDGALWVSDFYLHSVLRMTEDGVRTVIAEVPAQPGGLGWYRDGRLVVASMLNRQVLRERDGSGFEVLADLSGLTAWPLNDLAVDGDDNVYVGEFGFDVMSYAPLRPGSIFRIRPDGRADRVAEDMWFPNGMAVTGDGELVVAETFAQRLTGFRIGTDGVLENRREWASFGAVPRSRELVEILGGLSVAPDGICIDQEGAAWVADCIHQRAVRVRAGGAIVDEVRSGGAGVFACALGGADSRTLFLCCAPSFDEADRKVTRDAFLRRFRVMVPGVVGGAVSQGF